MQRPRGERGATLLDAVVGTALMLMVFVGIVGAFRLTVMAVSNNKARAGAIALANERLEFIRSLPYNSVGTTGGIPAGTIAQQEPVLLNDVNYTRRTFISWEDDPADGSGGADSNGIHTDYKAAKVTVSWTVRDGEHTITLISRISPPGIETAVPGGTLSFNVVDATLGPVSTAQVRIVNSGVTPAIDMTTYTDTAGLAMVLGAPPGAGYRITVTKPGYSAAQTYSSTATNTNPIPAHLGVALNQTTAATFAIDLLSTKTIETYTPVTAGTTTEPFAGTSGITTSSNIAVADGVARLTEDAETGYASSGEFMSNTVSTSTLYAWKRLVWDATTPANTSVAFRVYNASNGSLVPDSQIPGNSGGLTTSPVSLAGVSTSTQGLRVAATLTTGDASSTPSIDSYAVAMDTGPHLLPNTGLTMVGAKTIGTTVGGSLVYKYQNSSITSGPTGIVTLSDIEWDSYTISLNASTTYAISSACEAQPQTLAPNTTQVTRLFLVPFTAHSLLVDVRDGSGLPVSNATVRLYRGAYDMTMQTDVCGNVYFGSLSQGTSGTGNAYSIDASASGFQPYTSNTINVSDTSRMSIILTN